MAVPLLPVPVAQPVTQVVIDRPSHQREEVDFEIDDGLISKLTEEIDLWRKKYFALETKYHLLHSEARQVIAS